MIKQCKLATQKAQFADVFQVVLGNLLAEKNPVTLGAIYTRGVQRSQQRIQHSFQSCMGFSPMDMNREATLIVSLPSSHSEQGLGI